MLGERDPAAMVDEMNATSPGLFDEWAAFFRAEPFGPVVLNRMLARVCAAAGDDGDEDSYLPGVVNG